MATDIFTHVNTTTLLYHVATWHLLRKIDRLNELWEQSKGNNPTTELSQNGFCNANAHKIFKLNSMSRSCNNKYGFK